MQKVLMINGKDFLVMDMSAIDVQVCASNGHEDTHLGDYIADMVFDKFYKDGVYMRCQFEWYDRLEGLDRDSINFTDSAIAYYGVQKILEDEYKKLSALKTTHFTEEFFKSLTRRLLENTSEEDIKRIERLVMQDLFSKVEPDR